MISSLPDTTVQQYLNDLIRNSEEPFASVLKSIDLKKEGIKTPEDLIMYLFKNKQKYPEEAVSKSIANLISAKNISADNLKSLFTAAKQGYLWILWVLLGAGILGLFLILWRRKRNQKK
jgi:formiminotetrahydrofolate cyclodeaminase